MDDLIKRLEHRGHETYFGQEALRQHCATALKQLRARVLELETQLHESEAKYGIYLNTPTHVLVSRDTRIAELEKERDAAREEAERLNTILNHAKQMESLDRKELAAAREEAGARRQDLADFTRIVSKTVDDLKQEIAAQKLVIKQMKEALINVHQVACSGSPELEIAEQALALQPSTEQLDAYVAEAVKAEREACAKVCDSVQHQSRNSLFRSGATICSGEIRARSNKGNTNG